jgi:hypothetical protein
MKWIPRWHPLQLALTSPHVRLIIHTDVNALIHMKVLVKSLIHSATFFDVRDSCISSKTGSSCYFGHVIYHFSNNLHRRVGRSAKFGFIVR